MARSVSIDELEIGMVLADPIYNNFGQILIGADSELTQRQIKVLKTWNVKYINIKDNQEEQPLELNPELIEMARERIRSRMDWEPRNYNEMDLFNTAVEFTARQLLNNNT